MKRHCIRIHNEEYLLSGQNVLKIATDKPEIATNEPEIAKHELNIAKCELNIADNYNGLIKCDKCLKVLSTKPILKRHMKICKGVSNSNECHICHEIFNTAYSKSRHLKKCTSQALIIAPDEETTHYASQNISTLNNNGTINNNNLTNSNNNSGNTVNSNNTNIIIALNPGSGDMIEFITKHITNPELKQLIAPIQDGQPCTPEMVEIFTRHLLTNPENRCIEKTNLRSIHSKVHVGDNKWQTKHDKEILPLYACSVANNMDQTIKERLEDDKTLVDRRTLKAIEKYLDYMADKGYCNNADLAKEMQQQFYEIKHRLKAVIYDTTLSYKDPEPQSE
jgi:hypothetical protein